MRLYELYTKYRLHQQAGGWFINDLPIPDGEAAKINQHLSHLSGTVNRFDVGQRINDYLSAAYAVIAHPSNAEYLDHNDPMNEADLVPMKHSDYQGGTEIV